MEAAAEGDLLDADATDSRCGTLRLGCLAVTLPLRWRGVRVLFAGGGPGLRVLGEPWLTLILARRGEMGGGYGVGMLLMLPLAGQRRVETMDANRGGVAANVASVPLQMGSHVDEVAKERIHQHR